MKMLEAMRACEPFGYVARKAYPNRKYYKNSNGIFMEAAKVDHIDFIALDWKNHPPDCGTIKLLGCPKENGQDRKGGERSCP